MKEHIKPILSILLVLAIIILLSVITIKQYAKEHEKEDLGEFGEYTYEFTGDSNNYSFNTGKVFFDTNAFESKYDKKIVISDFERTSIIEGLLSEKLTISFMGNVWKKVTVKKGLKTIKEPIEEYNFEEVIAKNSKKNKSAFDLTTKDNFKDIIKIEMEYCTVEEGCKTEVFSLNYKERK